MKTILLALSVSLLFWSCDTKPTVVYPTDDNGQVGEQALIVDSTLVLTGDLPVYFDSTDYLLFPIGEIRVSSRAGSKLYLGSGGSGDFSFSSGYLSGSSYTGSLSKIMIQHLDSSNFRPITEQHLKIRSFQFLESIRKKTGQQLVVMTVTDRDTNNDGKLTNDDIESLYLSHLSGQNFKKLTFELQELLDWKILIVNKRLYFRTLEDIDKNGEFDKKDKIHHFLIDLTDPDFKVVEYNSLG
ncbi:hypothetical protein [Roseivirga echinicomitans]|uniref:EF-hand domain-containing protein n=1 Tax=Roseivirga echinicomitans TaxID=296218 RepID=A0A150XK80_9BACT|nr:hypothetical protein [Roseivirga echinicomitans]KYG79139.1 hypothetical protein AWN68_17885 [Roseivirga echinicomitans]